MACRCTRCPECKGTGNVWFSFSKEYLGHGRCDDLDEIETCEACGGDGISDLCDECREAQEDEMDRLMTDEN